ncbi:NADPH-dependent FMN reductase [Rhodococcus sp. SC4]|nr:NADPH-dependent FMN reductase [Rhodococcus sp. SC4]
MTAPTVAVVSAGLGRPSSTRLLADRLAAATTDALREHGAEPVVDVIELRERAHDIADNLITGYAPPGLRAALDQVDGAEGLIAVTPIFNASYSGLFKSFFDVLDPDALTGMPVLIGATGGSERHSLALEHAIRPMFSHLRSIVVPTAVYAATGDWGSVGADHSLTDRIHRAAVEFAALLANRTRSAAVPELNTPTPFEELLARSTTADPVAMRA